MDTLGHTEGGSVGLFECHGAGGNQVNAFISDLFNTWRLAPT